jgi:hypothetical protein
MTRQVLAGFCALCLYAQSPCRAASTPRDTLRVDLNVAFDASLSKKVRALAQEEATSIWKAHDVELHFQDSDGAAALRLDVVIKSNQSDPVFHQSPPALGRTLRDGLRHGSIRISVDRVEWTLECRHHIQTLLYERDLGWALGRVLAHEIGHALLGGPPFHDATGLMRAAFTADDLAQPEPKSFRLADESAARLRARIAAALNRQSEAEPPLECPY